MNNSRESSTEFAPPNHYEITKEEFEAPPTELRAYQPGDQIDRENFNSFFIRSFAISRGNVSAQILFFKWLEIHQGFNYTQTLENFIGAGGWEAMSADEQKEFKNHFNRIKIHGENYPQSIIVREIRAGIEQVLDDINVNMESESNLSAYNESLAKLINFAEFSEFIRDYIIKAQR